MKSKLLANITPGEILAEEFLKPKGITHYRLAKDIGVPPRRINEIVKGQRAITADTAFRLGRYSGDNPKYRTKLNGVSGVIARCPFTNSFVPLGVSVEPCD